MALMRFKYEEEDDDMHLWALDSGATKLSPYKELFKNLRGLEDKTYITFGNKTKEMVHGIGDICMMTRLQNGSDKTFTLENVLYVPGAMMNLFSVRQATSMGAGVEFAGSTCILKAPCTQRVIIQAIPRGDTSESAMAATAGETAQLWHRRFGWPHGL
jgi:hypothetical protein